LSVFLLSMFHCLIFKQVYNKFTIVIGCGREKTINTLFKPVILAILICFIFTVAPIPLFAAGVKADDNDRVTYQIDTHGEITVNQEFLLSVSAYYDNTPLTKLSFNKLRGFQLISSPSDGEFKLKAPPDGNKEYMLLMEGTANDQSKVTFSIPISVQNKASSMSIQTADNIYNTIYWVGMTVFVIFLVSMFKPF